MKGKKINKQKLKQKGALRSRIGWVVLVMLILAVPLAVWSNLFAYEYYYFKCQDKPTEIFGDYYRIPYDEGYGIHPGSDYSHCSYSTPPGKTRDPSTKAGMALAKGYEAPKADYDLYVPDGYTLSGLPASGPTGRETIFTVTTESGVTFRVRELNKNSDFSYTSLCSKPATENWSGIVLGKDGMGRAICRTNPSKYVKDYVVGIDIGRTSIMLQSKLSNSDDLLNSEATAIFSAMRPR